MLRRRGRVLIRKLSTPSAATTSPLHRIICAAAPPQAHARSCILSSLRRLISGATAPGISPTSGFAVEEYLVDTCGLTRPQALKASPKLSHLRSAANPDAVLAFLAGRGLSGADVAALVAKDPKFLCTKVDKGLSPIVTGLSGLGLSDPDMARLLSLAPHKFRCRSIVAKLHYYLPLFGGSSEKLLRAINFNTNLLCCKRRVELNVAFLRECGLGDPDIAKLCSSIPRMVTTNLERVQTMVALTEGLGVSRGSGMFRHALSAVAFLDEKKIAAKVDHLKKTLGWSDVEVSIALPKAPFLLAKSNESLQHGSEFLISEVGLKPAYIARRPVLLCYSLEGRMRPRYYVVKFLKENGLLKRDPSYYTVFKETEKYFVEKFICPHKEAAPHLAEDYAAACGGEVPARFRFTG
ncbi:transcription termination factor MTERF8, chloroplastic isoform X1 [Triticum aestivum]|nr:transcription termination factor MTERF8, chloroplastic-like isoform X1 [Triticum aestivum]VAI52689.1 unnamed protein product [Triticum turgidum subsp. durum]